MIAYKVDDAVNGGDKAQKAFKPGYDVTTDPFYQARLIYPPALDDLIYYVHMCGLKLTPRTPFKH